MGFAEKYRNELGLTAAIVAVVLFTLIFNRAYIEQPLLNLTDILHQTSLLGVFALGAAIVIIAGGIDLSSGSVIVFSASICAIVMMICAPQDAESANAALKGIGWWPVLLAIGVTLIVGLIIGTVHTWLITVIRLPPFVATLASLVGLRSFATVLNPAVTALLGDERTTLPAMSIRFGYLGQWWVALIVFLGLSLACYILMNHTVWGRHIYALGGNEEAARLSGIRTDRMKWLAYVIGSVTSSIAGVLYLAKVGSAAPSNMAVGYELNAIAAAVVGGCSLRGGLGLIPGVMLGVLFLRVVMDSIQKVIPKGSDDFQGMIVGLLVVLAVAVNEFRRQSGGARMAFFPGLLGSWMALILGLFLGAVAFVGHSLTAGIATGLVVFAAIVALRIYQGEAGILGLLRKRGGRD